MTLLEIVRQVLAELGLPSPAGVIGNQDQSVRQVFALLSRLGVDLCREHDWQQLITEASITTVAGQTQYALPADWKKQLPQTEWNRSNKERLLGPQNGQNWQLMKSGIQSVSGREMFRIKGGNLVLLQAPAAGQTITYEYVSKNFVVAATGARKPAFTADTDTTVFDDSLMVLGAKVLFLQAKGLDFALEGSQFSSLLAQCKAEDASAPMLSVSPTSRARLLSNDNVQEGDW